MLSNSCPASDCELEIEDWVREQIVVVGTTGTTRPLDDVVQHLSLCPPPPLLHLFRSSAQCHLQNNSCETYICSNLLQSNACNTTVTLSLILCVVQHCPAPAMNSSHIIYWSRTTGPGLGNLLHLLHFDSNCCLQQRFDMMKLHWVPIFIQN